MRVAPAPERRAGRSSGRLQRRGSRGTFGKPCGAGRSRSWPGASSGEARDFTAPISRRPSRRATGLLFPRSRIRRGTWVWRALRSGRRSLGGARIALPRARARSRGGARVHDGAREASHRALAAGGRCRPARRRARRARQAGAAEGAARSGVRRALEGHRPRPTRAGALYASGHRISPASANVYFRRFVQIHFCRAGGRVGESRAPLRGASRPERTS